jgi:hypothetical protein
MKRTVRAMFFRLTHSIYMEKLGWGARIRTWEWRNQNRSDFAFASSGILKNPRKSGSFAINGLGFVSEWRGVPLDALSLAGGAR